MSELVVSNIFKSFGANDVLEGVTFEVNKGYVYGIVGNNGCGKSTLFKIITGMIKEDSGDVFMRSGTRIGYLEQLPQIEDNKKAIDILNEAFENLHNIEKQLRAIEKQLEKDAHDDELLKKYSGLQLKYENLGGHSISEKIKRVTQGLKISEEMQNSDFHILSGGEKTRILLGKLLLTQTDILLLDEPTNHLDINSIEWLEKFIDSYEGTVMIISHDRYFLDKAVDYIVEMSRGRASLYKGNYSSYSLEKQKEIEKNAELYERQQKEIKRLADRARQLHDWANNEKTHRKAFAIEKRIERMEKIEKIYTDKKMKISVDSKQFAGKELLMVENLSFSYDGGKDIFQNAALALYNGENTAVLGPNGCGKTTFIKLILKELDTQEGRISLGASVKYAYLPQNVVFDDPGKTLLELVQFELGMKTGDARNLLAKYKFTGDDVFKEVRVLSGGEKSRLRLCLLLQNKINLLVLDEPTNHLDIVSREVLEDLLSEFDGALIFVSHDRYFIRKFANRIADIRDKTFAKYDGGYDFYRNEKEKEEELEKEININKNEKSEKQTRNEQDKKLKRENDPWRINKVAEIEEVVSQKEKEVDVIEGKLFSNISYEEILELTAKKEDILKEIEELMVLWEKYS